MADPEASSGPGVPPPASSARRAALRAAAIAGAFPLGLAAFRGQADLLFVALTGLGMAAGFLSAGWSRRGAAQERSAPPEPRFASLDTLLANAPDPVVLVDRRGIVHEANAAASALLPAMKLGHPLSFALRAPDILTGLEAVLARAEPRLVEYAERVPAERVFEVQISPLKGTGAGNSEGAALFFRDVTQARRSERMRVDFIANVSHELRTPLATLLGFVETLQGPARNDPAAREKFLAIMKTQAQRMKRLIDDLLSLSRIELAAHLAPSEPVDLGSIARQMIDTLGPLAREEEVTLRLSAGEGPLVVRGDRDELLRVVENLVENAIKYGGRGGAVTVGLRRIEAAGRAAKIELAVADRGPGIDPAHLPRLTERFYRVDAADSRQKGGTGLGLAIVKHIVNRHRGSLSIESVLGEGATFRVVLPAAGEPPASA